jgi:hypothetical protein
MNYIKRLEHELQEAQLDKQKADEIVNELFKYLNSSKFQCGDELDNYVNIKDIMTYLDRIRSVL